MKAIVGRLKKRAQVLIEQSASKNFIGLEGAAGKKLK